ncbi:MAG: hypothetical protein DRJ01_12515 [Bacteroidetes bacterium]|nr:MAG: hypothetical protein DRJ01_12515 [Bacteroidota bacterium]
MKSNNLKTNKVVLNTNDGFICISLDDILYVKSSNHYCFLYTNNNEEIKIATPLKQLENIFDNKYFYRCHRSYIVNLNYINMINTKTSIIYLVNEKEVPLSRRNKSELIKYLKETYNQNPSED